MYSRLAMAIGLVLVLFAGAASASDALPPPEDEVVLEVRGNISKVNHDDAALFSMAMLRGLGVVAYSSSSPWIVGRAHFKGVLLRDVLYSVGAREGDSIHARALDDYAVVIPWSDVVNYDVLLAYEMNGVTLSRRDKGPLWIVYPQDDLSDIVAAEVADRWIWQLETLEIK